jgi:tripartite-type tricarboxylate transporter receptor subunit TctC
MNTRKFLIGLATAGLLAAFSGGASAQQKGFFAGKTVDLYITQDAGTGYDLYSRLMADNIVKYLPGKPLIIPRNMQGAAGMRVMGFLLEVARKDGTVWGGVDRNVTVEPILYGKDSTAPYKNPLVFNWIGSLNTEIGVAAVWHTTGIKSWEELLTRPTIVAMESSRGGVAGRALNNILGTKFEQVCCYGSDSNQNLAMERGEVEGRVGWSWSSLRVSNMEWLQDGKIKLLMQVGLKKNPGIPGDPPLVLDIAKTDQQKQALKIIFANQSMGRPFVMPGGVPPERVADIRKAFSTMVKDPAFLAEAEKRHLEVSDPMSGEEVQALLKDVYASSPDAIASAQNAMKRGEVKMVKEPPKEPSKE